MDLIGRHVSPSVETPCLVEQVKRDALKPQQVVLLAVVDADHQQCDLQFVPGLQHAAGGGGNIKAMVARRIMMARALVERPRPRRGQFAMAGTTIALAMTEDRQIAGVMRVVAHRRRRSAVDAAAGAPPNTPGHGAGTVLA
jgi:hypothetical protein